MTKKHNFILIIVILINHQAGIRHVFGFYSSSGTLRWLHNETDVE